MLYLRASSFLAALVFTAVLLAAGCAAQTQKSAASLAAPDQTMEDAAAATKTAASAEDARFIALDFGTEKTLKPFRANVGGNRVIFSGDVTFGGSDYPDPIIGDYAQASGLTVIGLDKGPYRAAIIAQNSVTGGETTGGMVSFKVSPSRQTAEPSSTSMSLPQRSSRKMPSSTVSSSMTFRTPTGGGATSSPSRRGARSSSNRTGSSTSSSRLSHLRPRPRQATAVSADDFAKFIADARPRDTSSSSPKSSSSRSLLPTAR